MPAGNISLTLVAARDLKKKQLFGWQDPYVVIETGASKVRSKTAKDGNKNPKFDQRFDFSIGPDVQEVKFTVWNANRMHTDDLIGSGRLLLLQTFSKGYDDARVQLTSQDGKSCGDLSVMVSFQPSALPTSTSYNTHPVHAGYVGAVHPTGGELTVQVLRGSGLKDVEAIGQRQDPYVIVQVGTSRNKTQTVTDGGKNPKFDSRFVYSIGPQDSELKVELWDANVLRTDKIIGTGRLPLTSALQQGFHQAHIPLTSSKGASAGELEVFLTFKPMGAAPAMHAGYPQQTQQNLPVMQHQQSALGAVQYGAQVQQPFAVSPSQYSNVAPVSGISYVAAPQAYSLVQPMMVQPMPHSVAYGMPVMSHVASAAWPAI